MTVTTRLSQLLGIMTFCQLAWGEALNTYTLEPRFQPAENLVEVLKPLVSNNGTVTTFNNVLIIKTTATNYQELTQLLSQLDKPAKQLLISVRDNSRQTSTDRGFDTQARIKIGDTTISNTHPVPKKNRVIIRHGTQANQNNGVKQVRALEGQPAFIQVGQQIPVKEHSSYGNYHQSSTYYKNVTAGFYVTVRVSGNQAHIQLNSHNNRVNPQQQRTIDIQETNTTFSAPLGQWVNFGGISNNSQESNKELLSRHYSTANQQSQYAIKIDTL
ncbi:secretin N-terminal domain-containing protein [Spartinivicinus ruber]|uniref:secretin N-terminal domain-containing protein n=1 Tax=Spartinivicinus ruber TaxID=2683272 RepID=UPI0013D0123F|nr:secretin N-terminal domain-containing protein [Spartinivicinus ruber]